MSCKLEAKATEYLFILHPDWKLYFENRNVVSFFA